MGAGGDGACPKTLMEFLPAIEADCPASEPAPDSPCDIAENGICVWQTGVKGQGGPGYTVMGCYASLSGKTWFGAGQGALGEVGEHPENCPHAQPLAGSSCAGHVGENCYFPIAACSCAAEDGNWECEDNVKPVMVPAEVERLCPPAGIDEAKQLKDLSDAEALAWCNWYADPSGAPRPPITDNDPPGVAKSYSTRYIAVGASACIMDLPVEYCVQSLQLRPDCTATLAELDDCVESIRVAPGGWVGHGCAPLLANPTCKNVIAQPWEPPGVGVNLCEIPLE